MEGKTVVMTGATSGIGEQAALALARHGARIVFTARNAARADALSRRLEDIAPGRGHTAHLADLSLMREGKRVGAEIAAANPKIDALVNNAGAIYANRQVTAEGLERTFALNHMSYFVLTHALLDSLKASQVARIVSTASQSHLGAKLEFDDLQNARGYGAMRAYGRSKLCNILFTRELARRLAPGPVTANCVHPGVVASRFGDEAGGWMAPAFKIAKRLFAISPEAGADTLVYLVSSQDVAGVSGEYFAKRRPATVSPAGRDDRAAARLWAESEQLMARA